NNNIMGKPLKIGYLSADNILDKRSWSGIHYRMFTALRKEFPDIVIIGPFHNERINFILNKVNKYSLKFLSRRYNKSHNILRSKFYAYAIKKHIRNKKVD